MAKDTEQTAQVVELDENITEEALYTPTYDPTPPPEEPVGWSLDTVFVTIEGDEKDSLGGWGSHNVEARVILVSNEDGSIKFDFDDNEHGPANVIVYTNGRNPA